VYPLGRAEVREIRDAVAGLTAIYQKTGTLLKTLSEDTLYDLGVPAFLWPIARDHAPGALDCVIGRFDLARTKTGYKMLELNSDSPGMLVEAFAVNGAACEDSGYADPNRSCETGLCQALSQAIQTGHERSEKSGAGAGNVVVTYGKGLRRDQADAVYLAKILHSFAATTVPFQDLATADLSSGARGLYGPDGKPIDVLIRGCRLESLRSAMLIREQRLHDHETNGTFLHLAEQSKLTMINSPGACLLTNKALQAVIWNLMELGLYFNDEEMGLIRQYMLPTYWDPPADGRGYVAKPAQGASSDTVTVVDSKRKRVHKSSSCSYTDQPLVYQEYVDLPCERLMTEYGPRNLHLVMSCFTVGGAPSAICMRAGSAITDEMAWVVPLGVDTHL
jgi:glutathionylspermidine synthase